jgi:enamine deaminase RidA (YjgF/YER057c/UK114 family)
MRSFSASVVLIVSTSGAAQELKYLPADAHTRGSTAVIVGDVPLVHTAQFIDPGPDPHKRSAAEQAARVLDLVRAAIGGESSRIVRLNVCVANGRDTEPVFATLRKFLPDGKRPAVTLVVGKLTRPGAGVAMDAVATFDKRLPRVHFAGPEGPLGHRAAILPAGGRVFVSGQAEKADTPDDAARKTLASLRATLKWLDLDDTHVVQCKSFLKPISAVPEVTKVFEEHFGKGKVPPLVFVEWESSLPIEIELIAAAAEAKPGIEFLTPPGMTASPVYSRVTRVKSDRYIYTGGLVSAKPGTGEDQVAGTFDRLRGILQETGSDFKNLTKATYYVADNDASTALNKLRPNYYDPKRPPAASKALVAGTGVAGRTLILDMIAVPAEK